MFRATLFLAMAIALSLLPIGSRASDDNFRQEIRECYDEAFQAVLEDGAETRKSASCIELYNRAADEMEKAHSDAFYGALEEFSKEERKYIFSKMSADFMEATVFGLFAGDAELFDEISGVAQTGGDGLVNFGLKLYGVWQLREDQMCIRDGQCFPCGKQARDFLDNVIDGKDIKCRVGLGDRGVSEGLCVVEGKDIGLLLIENGWAELDEMDTAEDPKPFIQYFDAFAEAKRKSLGIHGTTYKNYYERNAGERLECTP